MPELPEVEVNRRGLEQLVKGKVIQALKLYWPRIIVGYENTENWEQYILHQEIQAVKRRGKYLIFQLSEGNLISHLRMEGKYFFYEAPEIPQQKNKHTHVIFQFTDGSQLHYNDVRKFGRIEYIAQGQLETFFQQKNLGPEPFKESFAYQPFADQLEKSKQVIKAALLSQKIVAGIGNIYADEVLFAAKIHPARKANTLSQAEVRALYQAILQIMTAATEAGGSSIRTYTNTLGEAGTYQNHLKVYGHKGEPCPKCQSPIAKIKIAQRGTHFCPKCQEEME